MSEKYTNRGSTVYENDEELSTIDVVDLLNEFNDENKELKAEIEQSDSISEDIVCADIQHQLLKVTDENKELKKENKKLIEEWEFSFRTEMAHHRFEEKELKEKIRKQQSTITELNKQNEQLRKELDSFNPVMFQDMRKGTVTLYSKGGIDE